MRILLFVLSMLLVAGCGAPQPVLAPSPRLQEAEPSRVRATIRECMAKADISAPESGAGHAAQESAEVSRRVATGTNVPGGGIMMGSSYSAAPPAPDSLAWRAAVERCLADHGYKVSGWE